MGLRDWLFIILSVLCCPENGCVYLKVIEHGGLRWQVEDLRHYLRPPSDTHNIWS